MTILTDGTDDSVAWSKIQEYGIEIVDKCMRQGNKGLIANFGIFAHYRLFFEAFDNRMCRYRRPSYNAAGL